MIHLASPFPAENPKTEDEIIKPAVEGTLAILSACKHHRIKRLVLTSSTAAVHGMVGEAHLLSQAQWLKQEALKHILIECHELEHEHPERLRAIRQSPTAPHFDFNH